MYYLLFNGYYHIYSSTHMSDFGCAHPIQAIKRFPSEAWAHEDRYYIEDGVCKYVVKGLPISAYAIVIATAPSLEDFPILYPELFI